MTNVVRGARMLALVASCLVGCDGPSLSGGDAGSVRDAAPPWGACSERCTFDPFELLTDPYLPARLLPGRARLATSRQPEPPEGIGNDDFNNYLRVDGTAHVLMEADGPGVLTRLWVTGRQPTPLIYEVLDDVVLHIEIDGTEVVWVEGESGVSLEMLTSGALPGFVRPWVAGRDTASNAFLVHVPIAFARSIRVWIDEPPGTGTLVFYQIDWRELPAAYTVESFTGAFTESQLDAIDTATQLWVDRTIDAPSQSTENEQTIAPGETASLVLTDPTTVRAISVELSDGSLEALDGELVVDGERAIDAPLVRWGFAAPPTQPYDSALATVGETAVTFRYPFPVRTGAELRLRNTSAAPVTARFAFEHDPGAPDPDLGALRASCGSMLTPAVGQNLTLLDVAGTRGHYAGQSLIVTSARNGFFSGFRVLEGDHEIEVDGEYLLGTGTEDYFGGSFYYERGPFALPLSGASYRSALDTSTEPVVSQYRHGLLDTVPFERALRFDYESFVAGSTFEYCLFWYEAP